MAEKITDCMANLSRELVERKGVAESTANLYVKVLWALNNKTPFKTLAFLRKKEDVMTKLGEYAESTQKSTLAAIVSVLSLMADKPTYKGVHKWYLDKMMEKVKESNEKDTAERSEKQKENWVSWEEVQKKQKELVEKVKGFSTKKALTSEEMETLLEAVILSLYVMIQPRRNQDYLNMVLVKRWKEDMAADKNYLDIGNSQFIFNKYKTAKKYGQQKVAIPAELMEVLGVYLRHHTPFKTTKNGAPFLITAGGAPLTAINGITRVLNRIFGKKVGSSMLRHIFLSAKYDIGEMKDDAAAMGHSLSEQRRYLKEAKEETEAAE